MNRNTILNGLLILLLIFSFVFIKQNFITSTKLSDRYLTDQDLLDKSEFIVEAIVVGKNAVVSYSGVEFITFNLHIKNQVEGTPLENEINVLQTIVPNDSTFKLLERGKEYVLFLDEYIGPVTSNAYVICGVNLGKIELLNDTVILNSRQKENFKILNLNSRYNLMSRIK